jgi:hypothetical protein
MGLDPDTNGPKLPVHQYFAAVAERKRGEITDQQVIEAFSLASDEIVDTTTLVQGSLTREEMHDVCCMAEQRIPPYNTEAAVETRLGLA